MVNKTESERVGNQEPGVMSGESIGGQQGKMQNKTYESNEGGMELDKSSSVGSSIGKSDSASSRGGGGGGNSMDIERMGTKGAEERKVPVVELSTFSAVVYDLAPKEKVTYHKEIQVVTEEDEEEILARVQKLKGLVSSENVEEKVKEAVQQERRRTEQELAEAKREASQREKDKQVEILKEQQVLEVLSEDVYRAVERGSKIIERALDEDYDITIDYGAAEVGDEAKESLMELQREFGSNKKGGEGGRSVTDLAFSSKHSELLAVSYNRDVMAPSEQDGMVEVWNLHLKERPEYRFYSNSDVLSVAMDEYSPTTIVGATYSGQVVIWDIRAGSSPVGRSNSGHSQPIFAVRLVGSRQNRMMVTTSTDGAMSVWQMDMLAAPIEQLALTDVSGIDFASSDTFWAGGHDGNVYSGSRVDKAGARAGLGSDRYVGHTSRISALHVHPNFSDIVLTASFDWSVRLFKHRAGLRPSSALVTSDAQNRRLNVRSIHAIDTFSDYVMDAKWSPSHPCVFAAVDAAGSLSLFDLSTNPEVPIESTSINNKSSSLPLAGLNKLAFGNAGRLIATGDTNGIIRTYSLAESLYSSSNDDFLLFTKLINNRI